MKLGAARGFVNASDKGSSGYRRRARAAAAPRRQRRDARRHRPSACLLGTCPLARGPLRPVHHGAVTRRAGTVLPPGHQGTGSDAGEAPPATRLGRAVRWGTVRMPGTFLTEDPTAVPASVVRFVAERLDIDDEHFAGYGTRSQTAHEHAREIRDEYGYRDFAAAEAELRKFPAARGGRRRRGRAPCSTGRWSGW
ncbi:DUF4158 domain-containing protein [Streptomyces hirsutus]|uniref:DUF4158 domain-containing protein n=1 Tax=Streptomyces hirsutus TaxID=35620 RepID=UPI0033ADB560